MATKETIVTDRVTAKEILDALGIKGELVSFCTPGRGQPVGSKDDCRKRVLLIVTRKGGGKR